MDDSNQYVRENNNLNFPRDLIQDVPAGIIETIAFNSKKFNDIRFQITWRVDHSLIGEYYNSFYCDLFLELYEKYWP